MKMNRRQDSAKRSRSVASLLSGSWKALSLIAVLTVSTFTLSGCICDINLLKGDWCSTGNGGGQGGEF